MLRALPAPTSLHHSCGEFLVLLLVRARNSTLGRSPIKTWSPWHPENHEGHKGLQFPWPFCWRWCMLCHLFARVPSWITFSIWLVILSGTLPNLSWSLGEVRIREVSSERSSRNDRTPRLNVSSLVLRRGHACQPNCLWQDFAVPHLQ